LWRTQITSKTCTDELGSSNSYAVTHVKVEYSGRDFSNDPALLADAQYEPGSCSTSYKKLFAEFHQNTISATKDKYFNQTGGFMAYWKYLYETVCAQHRTTFGRLPNKAT